MLCTAVRDAKRVVIDTPVALPALAHTILFEREPLASPAACVPACVLDAEIRKAANATAEGLPVKEPVARVAETAIAIAIANTRNRFARTQTSPSR